MPEDARMNMTLSSLQSRAGGSGNTSLAQNRIQNDIGRIKETTERVRNTTNMIIQYAHTLGYFEPPKDINPAVEPVITTMSDAITDMEKATNDLVGALNLFS